MKTDRYKLFAYGVLLFYDGYSARHYTDYFIDNFNNTLANIFGIATGIGIFIITIILFNLISKIIPKRWKFNE
jgi:hypothetical protein